VSAVDRGVLFVVSGPSGVGKSTLLQHCLDTFPDLAFSVSATTRAPRVGETDGVDYHFVQRERFEALIAGDAFIEHATVYDHSYGTLRETTDDAIRSGQSLILDIDVQGAAQVRTQMPEAVHIMVLPPNLEVLERRLRARGTDSDAVINRRMAQVTEQVQACGHFDYLVINDVLSVAQRTFNGIFDAEFSRRSRRSSVVAAVSGWAMNRG